MLILLGSSGLFAQSDSTEQFVLLEYGFPSVEEYSTVEDKIAKKWNIYHKLVAGCIVTDRLVDSVRVFNDKTYKSLAEKYGDDWKERYHQEIGEAHKEQMVVTSRLKIDTVLREDVHHTERIMNDADNTLLMVMTLQIKRNNQYRPIRINNLNDTSNEVIYRGFPNRFEIDLGTFAASYFHLECINCTISPKLFDDTLPVNHYCILPTRGKQAILNIYSHKEPLRSDTFSVQNLPDPEIYLNGVRNGQSIDVASLDTTIALECRYPDEITLRNQFTIEYWEMLVSQELKLHGTSSEIDKESLESLKLLELGTTISVICTVKGSDGVRRKKAAAFVLK